MGEKYNDKPNLGTYRTSAEPFPNPKGVKVFAGFGADETDLERGWCEPSTTNNPVYDRYNYLDRWTEPKESDLDGGDDDTMGNDFEFRMRDRQSKGFMTRPRIPKDRY